ncbi:MAG: VOC family protein [Verrucomicrobiota bacterium]
MGTRQSSPVPAIGELNHVALHVQDVARSCDFYSRVLGLQPMARPAFTFPGAWFRLGLSQELHLIGDRHEAVHSHHRGTHFALLTDDTHSWERHFLELGVTFQSRQRPDGASQLFITDPDGHVIELCTRPSAPGLPQAAG